MWLADHLQGDHVEGGCDGDMIIATYSTVGAAHA